MKTQVALKDTDFIFLKVKNLWTHFTRESLAFKSICIYIFIEYFRPQSIFPLIDFLPWAQIFLVMSLIGIFFDKKSKVGISKTYALILVFFIVVNLSTYFAWNRGWAVSNYFLFAQWVIILFLIPAIITTKERFYIFFLVFFLCCLKIAVGTSRVWIARGFSFTSWGLMGPEGYFQNSGELAVLMLILFPLSFYVYKALKNDVSKIEKYILLIAVISPLLTILGSSSRGAQIALLVQFFLMFHKKIFQPKFLVTISLVLALGWQVLPAEQKNRFTTIGEDKTSIQRQLYWENGWEMMKDNPALGVGFFNFQIYYSTYYKEDMLYRYAQLPHNIFIQVGTDTGFTGLVIYIFIIISATLRRYPTKIKAEKDSAVYSSIWLGLKFGLVGFVIAGQFVSIAYYPFLWIAIAMQDSLVRSVKNERV